MYLVPTGFSLKTKWWQGGFSTSSSVIYKTYKIVYSANCQITSIFKFFRKDPFPKNSPRLISAPVLPGPDKNFCLLDKKRCWDLATLPLPPDAGYLTDHLSLHFIRFTHHPFYTSSTPPSCFDRSSIWHFILFDTSSILQFILFDSS